MRTSNRFRQLFLPSHDNSTKHIYQSWLALTPASGNTSWVQRFLSQLASPWQRPALLASTPPTSSPGPLSPQCDGDSCSDNLSRQTQQNRTGGPPLVIGGHRTASTLGSAPWSASPGLPPLSASASTASAIANLSPAPPPAVAAPLLLAAGAAGVAAAVAATTPTAARPDAAPPPILLRRENPLLAQKQLHGRAAAPRSLAWMLQNQEPAAARPSSGGGGGSAAAASPPAAVAPPPLPPPQLREPLTEGRSYAVYDASGEPSSFDALLASLDSYDVVLLGEYHDDPVAHHLQLRLLRHVLGLPPSPTPPSPTPMPAATPAAGAVGASHAGGAAPTTSGPTNNAHSGAGPGPQQVTAMTAGTASAAVVSEEEERRRRRRLRPVALSLEMFERDVQGVMDEYLAGVATEADLMKDARPWPNYPTDYRPLVLAAKEAGAHVVCANAPRRHVSLVGRLGPSALASLPPASLRHLPPLPLRPPSERYVAKIAWTMRRAREGQDEGEADQETAAPLEHAAPEAGGGSAAAAAPVTAAAAAGGSGTGGSGGSSATSGSNGSSGSSSGGECPHIGLSLRRSNFAEAQNLWDAAMADSIAGALKRMREAAAAAEVEGGPEAAAAGTEGDSGGGGRPLVVHVCGKFHSEQRLGICEHLLAGAAPAPVRTFPQPPTSTPSGLSSGAPSPPSSSPPPSSPPSSSPTPPAPSTPAVCVVTFVPSGRGVCQPPSLLRGAGLHTLGEWLVLTDARLPRSFDSEHPV